MLETSWDLLFFYSLLWVFCTALLKAFLSMLFNSISIGCVNQKVLGKQWEELSPSLRR